MALRRKKNKSEEFPSLALAVEGSEAGEEWMSFPFPVVNTLRHMLSKVMRQDPFPARLALVAALRQEGVTYISRALGAIMAQDLELNVCVVELNWWWPAELPLQSLDNVGLAGVLEGDISLDEAFIHTTNPNLTILPAGNLPLSKRAAAARSSGLDQLIEDLNWRFDHLLLDIPSVLASNDAIPLSSHGTACCLVLRQGVTPIVKVRRALSDLDHLPNLGVIMNQVNIATPAFIVNMIPQE